MYTNSVLHLIGDSRLKELVPRLQENSYLDGFILNDQTKSGETVSDFLSAIEENKKMWQERERVFIALGVNDARKNKSVKQFGREIEQLIQEVIDTGSMPVLSDVFPVHSKETKVNNLISSYNDTLYKIALKAGCKFIGLANLLNELGKPINDRFYRDGLHFHSHSNDIVATNLARILERRFTTILWQYNGWSAKCNYRCNYCYYIGLHHPKDINPVNFEKWEDGFKSAFRQQELVFYCAHGEPTFGEGFNDLCDMIVKNEKWSLRVTSNIDTDFIKQATHPIFESNRLYINASYHQTQTTREEFLSRLEHLRQRGIECPIVYVAHPQYSDLWEDDIEYFRAQNFIVHFRRLQGEYKRKRYPWAYSESELGTFLKYTDTGTIKYMLNSRSNKGDVSFTGYDFFIVDNAGNVGHDSNAFEERTLNRSRLGNLLVGSFRPNKSPAAFPGEYAMTVDGVANIYRNDYAQLRNNNVIHFMNQGDVSKKGNRIEYGNYDRDFTSPKVRAELFLPPRNVRDNLVFWLSGQEFNLKIDVAVQSVKNKVRENPALSSLYYRFNPKRIK